MAINYSSVKLGEMTIRHGERKFKIQIRQGNCLAVFIHVRKMTEGEYGYKKGLYVHSLYLFFNDENHIKECIRHFGDMFDDEIVSIHLNTYYKESMTLLKHMTRCGHQVTAYYKEPKKK